jgi:hypothetical protein
VGRVFLGHVHDFGIEHALEVAVLLAAVPVAGDGVAVFGKQRVDFAAVFLVELVVFALMDFAHPFRLTLRKGGSGLCARYQNDDERPEDPGF